jgi:hypothetical protein
MSYSWSYSVSGFTSRASGKTLPFHDKEKFITKQYNQHNEILGAVAQQGRAAVS